MTSQSISIALATYNGAKYLKEQLASLARQTHAPVELVISDDGSHDDTPDIVASFAKQAPFDVRWLGNTVRLGFRGNFMRAAAECCGDVVAFCDQDDIWHKDKVQRVSDAFQVSNVLASFHNANVVDEQRNVIRRFYAAPPSPASAEPLTLPTWFYPFGFSLSIRRCLLGAIPFWCETRDPHDRNTPAAHDCLFFWLATSLGMVRYIDEPLVDYRQHGGNAFGQAPPVARFSEPWLRQRLGDRGDVLSHLTLVAQSVRETLSKMREQQDQSCTEDAWMRAVQSWQKAEDITRVRALLYSERRMIDRTKSIRTLFCMDGYGEGGFLTFGKREAIRDILVGVVASPLMRRLNWRSTYDGSLRRARMSL